MAVSQPIAVWEFNDSLADATGNGHTATSTSGSYVAGKLGNARSGAWSQADAAITNLVTATNFSLASWVYIDSSLDLSELGAWNAFMRNGSGIWGMTITAGYENSGDFVFDFGGATPVSSGMVTLPLDAFVHVAFVKSGTTAKIYLNGSQIATGSHGGVSGSGTPEIAISADGTPVTDSAAIFDVALTGAEVTELYNSGSGLAWANPWSAGGGAGARAFHLFRMMQGE